MYLVCIAAYLYVYYYETIRHSQLYHQDGLYNVHRKTYMYLHNHYSMYHQQELQT